MSNQRRELKAAQPITLRPGRDLMAEMEKLPDYRPRRAEFTEEHDRVIRAGWGRKNAVALSELLGVSTSTLRRRVRELGLTL